MCSGQAPVFEAYQAMLVKKVLEHDLQSGACTNRDGSPVYVLRLLAERDPRVREGDAGECLRMPGGVASVSGDGCVPRSPCRRFFSRFVVVVLVILSIHRRTNPFRTYALLPSDPPPPVLFTPCPSRPTPSRACSRLHHLSD